MNTAHKTEHHTAYHTGRPSRWPFPPPPRRKAYRSTPALATLLTDICLVTVWAAMIPGLMWLGAAGGF